MKLRESELQTERRVAAEAPVGGFAQKLPFKTLLANDRLWSTAVIAAAPRGRAAICGSLPGT